MSKIIEVLRSCQSIVDPCQGQTSQSRTVIPQSPIYQIFIETWKPVRTLPNAISERVLELSEGEVVQFNDFSMPKNPIFFGEIKCSLFSLEQEM